MKLQLTKTERLHIYTLAISFLTHLRFNPPYSPGRSCVHTHYLDRLKEFFYYNMRNCFSASTSP